MMGGTTGYYWKDMAAHPVAGYLENLDKPILVFQGEKDFQVSVEKDFEGFRQILGDRPNATLKVYPGLNHVFTTSAAKGTLKDYAVPGTVDSGLMDDVAAWIHAVDRGGDS
jgi:dienelactone hydrolase